MASPSASSLGSLIPIDHGACLPDAIGATADNIAWMSWPQAKEPFGPEELAYIRALDVEADMQYLSEVRSTGKRGHGCPDLAVRNLLP